MNKPVGKKLLWPCCASLFVTVLVPLGIAWYMFSPLNEVVDRRGDWPEFYETYVSRFVTIPPEATILEATDFTDFPMGGGFRVVFTLPNTKTPEDWMLLLTSGKGVDLREHKKSEYLYDASGAAWDVYWLQYQPKETRYILRYHWD
ncbi:MAG: hypothetical protein M3R13_11635 [Armatimonadota bacterium]|nr:hypothetical protein [Armatimonadota bacterium]